MAYQKLLIAEKSSVGKEVAAHIARKEGAEIINGRGYMELSCNIAVTWLAGHLYETSLPQYYADAQGLTGHPCVPKKWHIEPKDDRAKGQIKVIQGLIKQSKTLINLGDPDREGQLLVDELLIESGINPDDDRVQRLWVSAMDGESIDAALKAIKPNSTYRGFRLAALARQRSDWLIGMNGSKCLQDNCGVRKGVSMGRVQSPVLSMIVQRCDEIKNFKSVRHYIPTITMVDGSVLKWKHNGIQVPGVDEEGRIINESLANEIMNRAVANSWHVDKAESSDRLVSPPLPHSLDSLQGMFGKRQVKASAVLDAVQNMYSPEGGMKILSYPRVDTRYLPTSMLEKRQTVISGIAHLFEKQLKNIDLSIKGKAYNDKKVTAHHAIIPTGQSVPMSRLSPLEKDIYQEVTRCYIAQMQPDAKYNDFDLALSFGSDVFTAKTSVMFSPGWMATCSLSNGDSETTGGQVIKGAQKLNQIDANSLQNKSQG